MARIELSLSGFSALIVGLMACNPAYADRLAEPAASSAAIATTTAESPYQVDLIGEDGRMLDVYQHRGRFYVLGAAGERYTVRVSNPTSRRVEAVVSVDGLDVIDGKTADLRKRGYVVPAYGELRIDGFRVSTQHVATFRFSSVSQSYAGRKGQARNVGVIGVAIFEEQAPPELILSTPVPDATPGPRPRGRDYDYRHDLSADEAPAADKSADYDAGEAEMAPSRPSGEGTASGNTRSAPPPRSAAKSSSVGRGATAPRTDDARPATRCCGEPRKKKERPGLGTEFGEQRGSAVTWTRFVRANATVPTALAELRYNDVAGLQALGIQITPPVDAAEIETRESANPFPGSFAEPPR